MSTGRVLFAPAPAPTPAPGDVDADLAAALERFLTRQDVPMYLRGPAEVWLASRGSS